MNVDQMYLDIINAQQRHIEQLQANEQLLVLAVNELTLRVQALEEIVPGSRHFQEGGRHLAGPP